MIYKILMKNNMAEMGKCGHSMEIFLQKNSFCVTTLPATGLDTSRIFAQKRNCLRFLWSKKRVAQLFVNKFSHLY
jgi:hypothetical protein